MDWGFAHGRRQRTVEPRAARPAAHRQERRPAGHPRGRPCYAPGVPVGEVATVRSTPGASTKQATVDPFVDFSALDLVGVVVRAAAHGPARRRASAAAQASADAHRHGDCHRATASLAAQGRRVRSHRLPAGRGPCWPPRWRRAGCALQASAAGCHARPGAARARRPGALARGPEAGAVLGFGVGLALDLVPPPTTRSGSGRWCSALPATPSGWRTMTPRRRCSCHCSSSQRPRPGPHCLYAGTSALIGDPRISWVGVFQVVLTAVLYDVALAPFVVPGVMAVTRRVDPEPVGGRIR